MTSRHSGWQQYRSSPRKTGRWGVRRCGRAASAYALAVLLALFLGQLRPVRGRVLLGLDELRISDAAVTVGHHRRREHLEVLLALVGPDMADRALRTADRVRAVDLDAVQGHQQATAETLERGQGTLLADGVEAEREEVGKAVGVQPVQQVTNAVVTWDGLHTSVWQLERELCCCMRRWNSRKDGAWKKKAARAQAAASLRS